MIEKLYKKNVLKIIFGVVIYYLCVYLIDIFIRNFGVDFTGNMTVNLCARYIALLIIVILIVACSKFFITEEKKINYKAIIIIIGLIGIVLRTMYIIYTPIDVRQHDMNYKYEHLDYIETIYNNCKLPETNEIQFYQQPLHHIISACWLKVNTLLGVDLNTAEEGIQILTAIYSSIIIVITYCILKELNIDDKFKVLILSIIAVHPTFIILSGSINNDILMVMFLFLDILYLIKWNKEPNWGNTIILAISVALGALTKISSTIIAVPIIYIFIKKMIEEHKQFKNVWRDILKKYLLKFLVFGIISLCIGLSFSVRNKIKFDQDLFYVPTPGGRPINLSDCFYERITIFSKEMLNTFCDPSTDCNIFAYIVKCSLFGEFNVKNSQFSNNMFIVENMLKIFNIIIILISLVSLINIFTKKEKNIYIKMFLLFFLIELFMYAYGNITKPYGCTMDFRYIVPTIFIGLIFITENYKNQEEKKYKEISLIFLIFNVLSISFEVANLCILN